MSDRPVEDEILNEARNFGRALMALASQHGRAVSWIEQRRIRKEISRALRQQRQHEYLARQQHKMWTEQAVNRYRVHALAVTARSTDPSVGHQRRARDQVALRSHAADLQQMILNGRSLTPVEQGIALDGIDSATAYPGHASQRSMFAGAGRVKGINALRYRATVARTRAGMPHQVAEINELRQQIAAHRSTIGRDEPAQTPVRSEREAAAHKQVSMEAAAPAAAPTDAPVQPDRLAAVEKQLKEIAADRDRLSSKVTMLQKGFDSVSSSRDELRSKFDAAEGRISELTNRNQRLAAEIDEVRRDQPDIDALRAERDRFKTERDQAVAKLVNRTAPAERLGSAERQQVNQPSRRTRGETDEEIVENVVKWRVDAGLDREPWIPSPEMAELLAEEAQRGNSVAEDLVELNNKDRERAEQIERARNRAAQNQTNSRRNGIERSH